MYGRVTRYFHDKGYGFIRGEDNNTYFIHHSKLNGEYIKLKTMKEKSARNPKTGESCTVPEHKKVKFYAGEALAERIKELADQN